MSGTRIEALCRVVGAPRERMVGRADDGRCCLAEKQSDGTWKPISPWVEAGQVSRLAGLVLAGDVEAITWRFSLMSLAVAVAAIAAAAGDTEPGADFPTPAAAAFSEGSPAGGPVAEGKRPGGPETNSS